MSVYFIVSVDIDDPTVRSMYDQYIEKVKPIVERFGGKYVVRSELVSVFSGNWQPDRIIIIQFDSRERLETCFSSPEYRAIESLRVHSVKANAIVVEDGRDGCCEPYQE